MKNEMLYAKKLKEGFLKAANSSRIGICAGGLIGTVFSVLPIYASQSNSQSWVGAIDSMSNLFTTIYTALTGLSTVLLLFVVVFNLIRIMVSQESKVIQMSKEWIKTAIKGWLIINTLGYFLESAMMFTSGGGLNMQKWVDKAVTTYK